MSGDTPPAADASVEQWRAYWSGCQQPWRQEPEVEAARQVFLSERWAITPNIQQGIYPFSGVALTRADVEWLLEKKAPDAALDLRGAALSGADLSGLPLTRLRAGLTQDEWRNMRAQQLDAAAAHFERADLSGALLEGAILEGAHLEEARLAEARLTGANLSFALLEGASLSDAQIDDANLLGAMLDGALLTGASLRNAQLSNVSLAGAELFGAHLEGARLSEARLSGKRFDGDALERLRRWRADFPEILPGADLTGMFCDSATALDDAILGDPELGCVSLADMRLGGVNLAVVDWSLVRELGDERVARRTLALKDPVTRMASLKVALRANRQLAVALRDQGLNEDADRFAYRAQVVQRAVLLRQALDPDEALWPHGAHSPYAMRRRDGAGWRRLARRLWQRAQRLGACAFSYFLDLLAGYGYQPGRSLLAYLGSLIVFATLYFFVGRATGAPLTLIGAIALSISSFHGRGFFPGTITPGDPVTVLAAAEAIVGLIIEISFIATFTQRFFAR